jgi:hypothetical protein
MICMSRHPLPSFCFLRMNKLVLHPPAVRDTLLQSEPAHRQQKQRATPGPRAAVDLFLSWASARKTGKLDVSPEYWMPDLLDLPARARARERKGGKKWEAVLFAVFLQNK